jgi:hypothetical protein
MSVAERFTGSPVSYYSFYIHSRWVALDIRKSPNNGPRKRLIGLYPWLFEMQSGNREGLAIKEN